jgi:hypothetical protein
VRRDERAAPTLKVAPALNARLPSSLASELGMLAALRACARERRRAARAAGDAKCAQAVVTARLSSVTTKTAIDVMANVQGTCGFAVNLLTARGANPSHRSDSE